MAHPADRWLAFETTHVVLDPPEELIAERERLGLDFRDEVWGGHYHMVPAANNEHQRLGFELILILGPLARARGLEYRYETGLYDPLASRPSWFVPDQLAFRPEDATRRGVEGRAELVIEFRSPGDETYQKIPHYERIGVQEVLVIDRDTKAVRHWTRQNERLVDTTATPVELQAVEARLWTEGETLLVETAAGTHRI